MLRIEYVRILTANEGIKWLWLLLFTKISAQKHKLLTSDVNCSGGSICSNLIYWSVIWKQSAMRIEWGTTLKKRNNSNKALPAWKTCCSNVQSWSALEQVDLYVHTLRKVQAGRLLTVAFSLWTWLSPSILVEISSYPDCIGMSPLAHSYKTLQNPHQKSTEELYHICQLLRRSMKPLLSETLHRTSPSEVTPQQNQLHPNRFAATEPVSFRIRSEHAALFPSLLLSFL